MVKKGDRTWVVRPSKGFGQSQPPLRKRKFRFGEPENPTAMAAILEVIDHQLRDRNPPVVHETLERLVTQEGFTDTEARRLISTALLWEMNQMLRDQVPFDEARYTDLLRQLPALFED